LLTKLENQEFKTNESIKFCRVTKDVIAMYEDWLTLKEITLTHSLDKNIPLIIHPALAEILISNLMSNAIRHNQEKGLIRVELTKKDFCVSNTGLPPQIPTQELFKRFKKSNQCNESIGLGLAIVKQICEVNGFAITYQYSKGWHSVRIVFDPPKKEMNITAVPELEAAEV
jgi:signal transduction histidine kinase